jgi:hypothetical protein
MLKTYILSQTVKTPFVVNTNMPHKPQAIKFKTFKAGETVTGKLQMKNGKPSFLLVNNTLVIPITALKEVITKDIITSNVDGKAVKEGLEKKLKNGNPKTKYADAAIIGAILGAGAVFLAEKKQWISVPSQKNKLIGAAAGALLLLYAVYRIRNKTP